MVWGIRDLDFRGMDVVEVSPPYDHADATAIAARRWSSITSRRWR